MRISEVRTHETTDVFGEPAQTCHITVEIKPVDVQHFDEKELVRIVREQLKLTASKKRK